MSALRLLPLVADQGADTRDADRFRALSAAVGEIVFSTSPDGRRVEMPRWLEVTGQTEADLVDFGWLEAIHPDDRAATIAGWNQALAAVSLFRTIYRLRMRDGAYRRFEIRVAPVPDETGGVREWIGVCTDIEDREVAERAVLRHADDLRRTEQRFRSLVKAVASVVWVLPPSGQFETEQESWREFTGQELADARGDGWLAAIHPDDRAHTALAWHRAHSTSSRYEVSHRLRRADGVYVPMAVNAVPILDRDGEVREWVGFHVDVSRLQETEDELRRLTADLERRVAERTDALEAAHRALTETNENLEAIVAARTDELRRANEEVQRFAYIVSHDLRAPLVNIMGFANELRTLQRGLSAMLAGLDPAGRAALGDRPDELDRDIGESLDFILQSTGKMDRLIAAILRLSREGRRAFTPEPIDLVALLSGIKASLAHQCGARHATITVDADLPVLTADRLAVEQVLTNLVENAVKYLRPGVPGQVRIGATATAGRVRIAVADNGRGIAAHDFERIFELFRRAGAQDQPGDGIGLAFVRAQVRRLGGSIACQSTPTEGSVFTVDLPLEAADASTGAG